MDQELNDRLVALLVESGAGEQDQRSALGMARTWMEKGKAVVRSSAIMAVRDGLAEGLIEAIRGSERDDSLTALREARAWLNAPFVDPTMNGQKLGRAALLKPGGAVEEVG